MNSISNALGNAKVFRFISYTLVFLMMACIIMTLSILIQNAAPGGHAGIIAGILLFVLIDRFYTYRQTKHLVLFSSEWMVTLGAQWLLIAVLSRFLLSYANGLDAFRAELARLARGDLVSFFTPELIFCILLAVLIWYGTGRFLDLLDEISLDQERALREESVPVEMNVVPAHHRLVSLIFSLGILVVILALLTRIKFESIVSNTQGLPNVEVSRFSGGEAGALLYFVFGLVLLSLSRLLSLQTRWNQLRIPVSSRNLTRQWGIYSLLFFLILAVLVSLLPAGDSFGLFFVLRTLISFIFLILVFLAQLLFALVWLLFSLPFFLFRGTPLPTERLPPITSLHNLPPPPPPSPEANAAWMLIRSILLWGGLAVILTFALMQYARQHGGIVPALRNSRLGNWLILAWQWLSRNAKKTGAGISRAIADGWQNLVSRLERKDILPGSNLIRLRSLDPRRQVYFFYLAMIRRGGEQGVSRKPSQSPSEYAVTLEKALPEADEDIDSITKAFVEARYSRREFDVNDANIVKATWARIRRALQTKSDNEKSEKK